MGDRNDDSFHTGENYEENQDKGSEPIRLIPEGFVVDDSQTSISLEDFEEDNEVWLIDIPLTVDPKKLFGQQLDFRQESSFIIDEQENERCISLPSSEPCSAICLLSSRHENSKKIVALNPAGKISINISYDVPEFGNMIPESTSVQLPEGLKVRHPFLGARYKDIVKSMEGIEEKFAIRKSDISPINHVAQDKRKILVNDSISTDFGPEEEVQGESVDATTVKNEILSPKKSKKRKRESLYEDGNNEGVEHISDDPHHLPKKHKKEQKEGTFIQVMMQTGYPYKELSSEIMEISAVESVPVKKSKKDKKRISEAVESEVNAATLKKEVDDAPNASLKTPKKKIKKEKEPWWSGEEEGVMGVPQVESPKKAKKKKKRDSEFVSEAGLSSVLPEDIVMIGEVPDRTLERVKEAKNGLKEDRYEGVVDVSFKEEGDGIQEMVHSESRKIKKEKLKKRCTIDYVEIEAASMDSSAVHLMAGQKMKESTGRGIQSKGIEVLHEEGDHVKKKRKKDKKRASEVVNIELDVETLKEEVDFIPDTPEQTPKKKKKKIKEEPGCSVKEEGVEDVSFVEPSVPHEVGEETPKKAKKKKKRDSEYGGGSGQGNVLSHVVVVEEMPDNTIERVKKIKKETKRELKRNVLEEYCEGDNDAEPRKSNKILLMHKVAVEDAYVDRQDPNLIAERKGTEGMETFNEGIEVLHEEGDHMKKKRKKDKKRASEVVNIELDVETLKEEVDFIPDTPEQTPKKKKKKIKEEPGCSVKEEGVEDVSFVEPSVPHEVGEETPKKAKKKKKRDSEYGGGSGQSDVFSDVVVVEEMPGQTSEVVGKSKKEKWYIDREPSTGESYDNIKRLPDGKKMKKVQGEALLDVQHEGENSGVDSIINQDSKKWKKRQTMDSSDTSAVNTDSNMVHLLPEMKMEGKSQHKKRYSLLTQGFEAHVLSPKKEKKIKRESIK